jgi:glucose-1-phosphate thymidylyltransferase
MKVIIPLAGKGTRLRPHTHLVPKPLLRIAGKPVMQYILDDLKRLGNVDEIIYITGHLRDKVEEYVHVHTDFRSLFIEQKVQDGTAGAVALAREHIDQPVLIIFVDTIFDADLSLIRSVDADGIIWVKEVEDYKRFGVVVTDSDGFMQTIVEKPDTPVSKRANIGLYYIRDWKLLFEGIDHVLRQPKNKGEYFLTDAFQYMIDKGARIKVVDAEGWYDAGKLDTLLETNREILSRSPHAPVAPPGCTINEPVYIEADVRLESSVIGPNVSLGRGSVVLSSQLHDVIAGVDVRISGAKLHDSLIGDGAVVEGIVGAVSVGDHSEVRGD